MSTSNFRTANRMVVAALALLAMMIPWSLVHAGRAIQERRNADPQGSVDIDDVSGSIEVSAWDRPEVEVTGTVEDEVDRVDVTGTKDHTSIHVVMHSGINWHNDSDATHLVIHVPAKSSVSATLVTANLKIGGVQGDVNLHTVSGNVGGDVGGDLRVNTVSGDVRMTAAKAQMVEVKTINGSIQLASGAGEVIVTTISGDAKLELGALTHGRLKSISGKLSASLSLAPGAQLSGESISGNLRIDFPAAPAADFDIQTLSGSIESCFGPKPSESRYGPGSHLAFQSGDGHAHVRIETKSGDVHLCAAGMHSERTAAMHTERVANCLVSQAHRWPSIRYVL